MCFESIQINRYFSKQTKNPCKPSGKKSKIKQHTYKQLFEVFS